MNIEQIIDQLRSTKRKLVVAESLTGGLLTYQFSKIPGASDVLVAGIVAYETSLKNQLLGVSKSLLENQGPVDPEVAAQMAQGLRRSIATKLGLEIRDLVSVATTGVAGPAMQGNKPVGEVFIAISVGDQDSSSSNVYSHQLSGIRTEIQEAVVLLALNHLWEEISG